MTSLLYLNDCFSTSLARAGKEPYPMFAISAVSSSYWTHEGD